MSSSVPLFVQFVQTLTIASVKCTDLIIDMDWSGPSDDYRIFKSLNINILRLTPDVNFTHISELDDIQRSTHSRTSPLPMQYSISFPESIPVEQKGQPSITRHHFSGTRGSYSFWRQTHSGATKTKQKTFSLFSFLVRAGFIKPELFYA